jgi:outer membrane protein TolC
MTARTPYALLIGLILSLPSASTAAEPLALQLSEAVDIALGRNPTVGRARETITEFDLQVREVRAEALPQLGPVCKRTRL